MKISSKFKSIQSSIFCAVSILVLSAVLVVTVVSLRYTNSSIYENSVMYTQTIIKQLRRLCTEKSIKQNKMNGCKTEQNGLL